MTNRIGPRAEERAKIACDFLRLAQSDIATTQRTRLYYIRLAREYQVTWADIGKALGMSAAAAQMMLLRDEAK